MKRNKKKKGKGIIGEFKEFITRGNIIDLAVGVIIGGAFSTIVKALTNNIIMPLINRIVYQATGGKGIDLVTALNSEERFLADGTANPKFIGIDWGIFINAVIDFLLIALVLFALVKIINTIRTRKEALDAKMLEKYYEKHPEERPVEPAPEEPKPTELDVLNEIRDLLKENQKTKTKSSKISNKK